MKFIERDPLEASKIESLAKRLTDARLNAAPIEQISNSETEFDQNDAYSIQELGIAHRVESGEKIIGLKMGLTSEAKRKQMNLDSPLYGVLTNKMQCENKGSYSLKNQIHPKIEPEVAFLFNKDLEGIVTREEVLAACEAVCPCMEILDSRYQQFKYFSMEDVISDNSSSSQFILGNWVKEFRSVDLGNLKMEMFVNGELSQSGNSSAISGDPIISIIQQCELLAKRNQKIHAGQFVLAGAATAAVQLMPGMEIELKVESLGNVSIKVEE